MPLAKDRVRAIFASLASDSPEEFWNHVADDVDWTVLGTHRLAGRYVGKAQFRQATFARSDRWFDERLKLQTRSVLVDGDRVAGELYARGVAKSGIRFDNDSCWFCPFHDEKIVSVWADLDSALMAKRMQLSHA